MTGTQVRELRAALRLDPTHFAQLLGVHPSTLYRWEAAGDVPVRVEPFQLQILAMLQRQIAAPTAGNEDLSETILKKLLVKSAMFGLFKLLEAAFSDKKPRRTGGAVAQGKVPHARSSPTRKRSPR